MDLVTLGSIRRSAARANGVCGNAMFESQSQSLRDLRLA